MGTTGEGGIGISPLAMSPIGSFYSSSGLTPTLIDYSLSASIVSTQIRVTRRVTDYAVGTDAVVSVVRSFPADHAYSVDSAMSHLLVSKSIADSALATDSALRVSTLSRFVSDSALASDRVFPFVFGVRDTAVANDAINASLYIPYIGEIAVAIVTWALMEASEVTMAVATASCVTQALTV